MPLAFALMIALVWGQLFQQTSFWQFAVYVYSGMIVWEYVSVGISVGLESLVTATGYLQTARIPLLIFQLRVPLTGLAVLFFGFIGLEILLISLGQMPPGGLHLLLIPVFAGLLLMFIAPLTIILSLLGTQFRDLRYITALVVQAMFFVSPVMLHRDFLDKPELQFLTYLNPMISIMDLFRDPVLYGKLWNSASLTILAIWIGCLWIVAVALSIKIGRKVVFAL